MLKEVSQSLPSSDRESVDAAFAILATVPDFFAKLRQDRQQIAFNGVNSDEKETLRLIQEAKAVDRFLGMLAKDIEDNYKPDSTNA